MENILDNSWIVERFGDDQIDYYYQRGASDFQTRALEELQKLLDEEDTGNVALNKGFNGACKGAIEIIKNLKA